MALEVLTYGPAISDAKASISTASAYHYEQHHRLPSSQKQVMRERDAAKLLTGRVEIDDAYLGGERSGGKLAETRSVCGWGRGAPGKAPFAAAVETTPDGKPVRLELGGVVSFYRASIAGFAKRSLDPAYRPC